MWCFCGCFDVFLTTASVDTMFSCSFLKYLFLTYISAFNVEIAVRMTSFGVYMDHFTFVVGFSRCLSITTLFEISDWFSLRRWV